MGTGELIFLGLFIVIVISLFWSKFKVLMLRKELGPMADGELGIGTQESDDPVIIESDFKMAYGLYDEAEEMLRAGIERDPANVEYKFRLMTTYFVWGKARRFREAGAEFRRELRTSSEWDKIQQMAEQLCPDDPTFS